MSNHLFMDYLVDFTITVPEGTPASELEQRMAGEAARVAELAAEGHALRVWKPLPDVGRPQAIGLYRAADYSELQAILDSLPLRPWMEIVVTELAEHPNDPALSSRITPPDGHPGRYRAPDPVLAFLEGL